MRAVPASSLGLERLVEVWNAAYAGYFVPMSWDLSQLERHVHVGSVDLDRSLVWMDGSDPIGLSLLGARPDVPEPASSAHSTVETDHTKSSAQDPPSGSQRLRAKSEHSTDHAKSSAQDPPSEAGERGWIGGFGIAPSHRGRGLAAGLMREQLEVARESGVLHVQLEVLTQNWAARSYERAGFVTTRRLLVLQGTLARAGAHAEDAVPGAVWRAPGDLPDLAGQLRRLHAAYASAWTREPHSALSDTNGLRCLASGSADALEAVLLLREHGDALQVVDAAACNATAAHRLVAEMTFEYLGRELRLVNEPEGSPLANACARAGLVEVLAQYEMHWAA